MNEDFICLELAKKLKEKGLKELCLAYYTNDNTLYYNYSHKAGACYKDCYRSHNLMPKDSASGKFVDAPTISQVLKWLRDDKKIHIQIIVYENGWYFEIWQYNDSATFKFQGEDCDSYEKAALAGITWTLDNLI